MGETITYTDLCALLGGEPSVPVFWHDYKQPERIATKITCYVPDWTPVVKHEELCRRLREGARVALDITVVLVTDVPQERLFGEWREAMPQADQEE